jgi:hypothetical protein
VPLPRLSCQLTFLACVWFEHRVHQVEAAHDQVVVGGGNSLPQLLAHQLQRVRNDCVEQPRQYLYSSTTYTHISKTVCWAVTGVCLQHPLYVDAPSHLAETPHKTNRQMHSTRCGTVMDVVLQRKIQQLEIL